MSAERIAQGSVHAIHTHAGGSMLLKNPNGTEREYSVWADHLETIIGKRLSVEDMQPVTSEGERCCLKFRVVTFQMKSLASGSQQ